MRLVFFVFVFCFGCSVACFLVFEFFVLTCERSLGELKRAAGRLPSPQVAPRCGRMPGASASQAQECGAGFFGRLAFRCRRALSFGLQVCFLRSERQRTCASVSYWYVGAKAQLQFDDAITPSGGGMSGSNSSAELVQERSANARHSRNSNLWSSTSRGGCGWGVCPARPGQSVFAVKGFGARSPYLG